jgi:curved DNA-binding protein CbpA
VLIYLPMPDYYKILDLPWGASKTEIKKAYRKKVMQYHPDRNSSSEAQALFIQLTEAYEMLMGEAPANRRRASGKARQQPHNQTDHYAFYQHASSPAVEARRRAAKERVDRQTQQRFEQVRRENEAFRQSWQYKLLKSMGNLLKAFVLLLALASVIVPVVATFRTGRIIYLGLALPLWIIGGVLLYKTFQYYQRSRK